MAWRVGPGWAIISIRMSETPPEPDDPHGGFSRLVPIVLVVVGGLWVTLSLRQEPETAPATAAVASVTDETAPPAAPQMPPPQDTTQHPDVQQEEDAALSAQETGPEPEELKRRAAMARRAASRGRDPVKILIGDAQRLLDEGRNDEAIERARQAMLVRKSPQAYAIETRAFCAKGDSDKARRAFKRVLGTQREPTLVACAERGVQLLEP